MKTHKYILLAIILIFLSVSSFPHIISGISSNRTIPESPGLSQLGDLMFLETYTYAELTSELDASDPFFQMINTGETVQSSSKLGFCPVSKMTETWTYLHSPAFQKNMPDHLLFAWGVSQDDSGKYLYALKKLDSGNIAPEQSDIKEIEIRDGNILLTFTEEGGEKFAALTKKNVGRDIAITFKDQVYAAPRVRETIKQGKCMISGDFSKSELDELVSVLE